MGRGKNRGRRKRKESEGPFERNLSDEELDAALAEIGAGSDRVAAIMGAALVENALVGALLTCLKDKSEAAKLFDDVRGPFNTFYAQILGGRAFGLYDEATEDALHAVREIRNMFAHSPHSLDFSIAPIEKKITDKLKRIHDEAAERLEYKGVTDVRGQFEAACYSLTTQLMKAITESLLRTVEDMKAELAGQNSALAPENLRHIYERVSAALKGSG